MGYARTRRNPSAEPFIYTTKDRTDIFDLEKTQQRLEAAVAFATELGQAGKTVLFVGGKNEAQAAVKAAAESAGLPYIRKRIDRLEKLMNDRETGELGKYTKRERLMIDREIEELLGRFGGIVGLKDVPAALFVVDTRHENTAVREANQMKIPVIGLASSDCDFSLVQYPIPGNDTSIRSIRLVTDAIAEAYQSGKKAPVAK